MAKKSGNKQQKLTAQQKSDRIKAAKEREARAQAQRERSAKMKKIFTVVVCVILVLALGIPTIGAVRAHGVTVAVGRSCGEPQGCRLFFRLRGACGNRGVMRGVLP